MKFRNDTFLLKCIILMVFAIIVLSQPGCASWTTEYWEEQYEQMTPEEIEAAKARGGELITICDLTDCIFVWVY